jgi:hypothetical protein
VLVGAKVSNHPQPWMGSFNQPLMLLAMENSHNQQKIKMWTIKD